MFVAVLVVGLALAWALDGPPQSAETGQPAPDFTVELLDGGSFTLADHVSDDGRPVVLNLWASWCPPCREEIPDLSAFAASNPGVAVVGVAVEDRVEDARAFAAEIRPDYPLAIGNAGFEESYPNFGLPVTYFLDGSGEVIEVFNGVLTVEALEEKTR